MRHAPWHTRWNGLREFPSGFCTWLSVLHTCCHYYLLTFGNIRITLKDYWSTTACSTGYGSCPKRLHLISGKGQFSVYPPSPLPLHSALAISPVLMHYSCFLTWAGGGEWLTEWVFIFFKVQVIRVLWCVTCLCWASKAFLHEGGDIALWI